MEESKNQALRRPTPDDSVGTALGRYQIRSLLGAGGMGEVYLAYDPQLRRSVALKRLAPQLRGDEQYHQRFLQEGARASSLNHPNIASIYDVFEASNELALVMEYVEGRTLRERLRDPVSLGEFLPLALQCAQGLAAAHEKGISHGDMKPENIMVTAASQVKILDFGLAKRTTVSDENADTETMDVRTHSLRGTPGYMAPEMLLDRSVDARADIFALGVVFYEVLTRRHPFIASSFMATGQRVLNEEPPPPSQTNADVPVELDQIVGRMLAKDPGERYATAADLVEDLRAVGRGGELYETGEWWKRKRRSSSTWRWGAATVLAIVILLTAVIYRMRRPGATRPDSGTVPAVHSVAIMPFRKIVGPDSYNYFGVGLAEFLAAKLTNGRLLEVRTPRPDASDSDPVGMGRKLGVDAVLTGHYEVVGANVQVTYGLTEVRTGRVILGDSLPSRLGDEIELERRMFSGIIDMLPVAATKEDRLRLVSAPTNQNQAFQEYLRSDYEMEQFWRIPGKQQLDRAQEHLRKALDLDANFALARSDLARLHWITAFWGYANDPGILDRAEREADLAIQQDPTLGEAYASRALVELQRGQLDAVRGSLKLASARAPNCALVYYAAGFYFMARGLADESVKAFRRARQIDPKLVRREIGLAHRYAGQFAEAERQLKADLQQYPGDTATEAALASVLVARGSMQEARVYERDLLNRAPADPSARYIEALVRVSQGESSGLEKWISDYGHNYWTDGGYCVNVASVYAVAGRHVEALRWLQRASDLGVRNYPFLKGNPLFDNVRQYPAFGSYLEAEAAAWKTRQELEQRDPLFPAVTDVSPTHTRTRRDREILGIVPTPAA